MRAFILTVCIALGAAAMLVAPVAFLGLALPVDALGGTPFAVAKVFFAAH